jgi:hypothetical protein
MTHQSAASRFEGYSLLAIGTGVAAAVGVGLVCHLLQLPQEVQGPLTGSAVGIPAAIDYHLKARRRDLREDIARIQRNDLRRPLGVVVAMFAAALLAIEQAGMFSGLRGAGFLLAFVLGLVADFFIASYASHYVGEHPYRWTTVAVVCACVAQLLRLIPSGHVKIYGNLYWRGEAHIGASHLGLGLGWLVTLAVCSAGSWYGRRHHEKFLAKKLARMQRKPPLPGTDSFEQLKKLTELRDAGVLTDDEFQVKKAQIFEQL